MILFGNEAGVADVCSEMGLLHVPDVATNEFGTPLLGDIFDRAQNLARHDSTCFLNADIVLTGRNIAAIHAVRRWGHPFMVVGQRLDLDVTGLISAGSDVAEWATNIAGPDPVSAGDHYIDWFAFLRGRLTGLPPFAIGRPGYDNWLLWHAAASGMDLVDATAFAPIYHQRHDYGHVGRKVDVWRGPEAVRNRLMVGHWSRFHTIADAHWMLNAEGEVVPARGWRYRLARPRRALSHALSFTRPLRWRLEREPVPKVTRPG